MSASESTAVSAVPVDEVVSTETTAVVAATESNVQEPAAVVAEVVTPAVEAEAATEEPKEVEEKKDAVPKSPSFLARLLSNFKGEKKSKAPKSPKKEKKEEVEAPATEEAPKEVEAPVEAVETAPEAEPVATEATTASEVVAVVTEEIKEEVPPAVQKEASKAVKVGRRLSSRVGDFFKPKPKSEVTASAKVDELPPMIETPAPVAPLENPASDAPKVEEIAKVEAAAPVVAATA